MSIKQKIVLGLSFFVLTLFGVFLFSQKALAAPVNDVSFTSPTYTITALQNCSGTNKPQTIQVTIAGQQFTFTDTVPCDNNMNLKTAGNVSFICAQTTPTTGITLQGSGQSYTGFITINYKNDTSQTCAGNADAFLNRATITVVVNTSTTPPPGGTVPCTPGPSDPTCTCTGNPGTGLVCTKPAAAAGPNETCEAKWSNPLTWMLCPLFNIAAEGANLLIDLFKDQLCFKVDASPTSPNATCEGKITDTSGIKPAWDAIKNIVSALLVIVMLIAVFAQAASIGPIDAYTLRKLLPRLVAAVILIQISFYLFSWVVNLVDDIGEGLDSLLGTIFPGEINNLNWLLGNAGVGDKVAAPVSWLALITLIGLAVAALPALLLALFGAIIALLIGLAVLVFRKVLIIALLLIAPVALLLWVLPNTERYWKMWWDNFLRVLLMFPIIVLLIEAGRIFAYVAGPATGGGFIGLFVVMVGFFGPLLILPKTFRWGGTLMQMTGGALERAGSRVQTPGKEQLATLANRARGNIAQRYQMTQPGFRGALKRGILRTAAGNPIPLRRQNLELLKKGAEYKQELVDAEQYRINNAYKEVLARTGSVKDAKKYVMENFVTSDDAYRRRAGYNFMIDSSSWLEMDDPEIRTLKSGKDAGKDIFKTQEWSDTLHASPERYAKVAQARPDWQPFELPVGGGPEDDDVRLENVLNKMSVADLQRVHPSTYKEIARQAQAGKTRAAGKLATMLDEAKSLPGGSGIFQITPLMGGEQSARGAINDAMSAIRHDTLDDILGTSQAARGAAAGAAVTPVIRTVPTEGGEIRIHREPRVVTLQPGDQVSEGGVVLPQERRARPPEPPTPTPPAA